MARSRVELCEAARRLPEIARNFMLPGGCAGAIIMPTSRGYCRRKKARAKHVRRGLGAASWPGACLLGGRGLRGVRRGGLFSRLFICQVTPDDTAADSADHRVMAGIVAGHAAYRGAFQATLGAGAASGASQCNCA